MPTFKYAAKTNDGKTIRGTVVANAPAEVVTELRRKNLVILDVQETSRRSAAAEGLRGLRSARAAGQGAQGRAGHLHAPALDDDQRGHPAARVARGPGRPDRQPRLRQDDEDRRRGRARRLRLLHRAQPPAQGLRPDLRQHGEGRRGVGPARRDPGAPGRVPRGDRQAEARDQGGDDLSVRLARHGPRHHHVPHDRDRAAVPADLRVPRHQAAGADRGGHELVAVARAQLADRHRRRGRVASSRSASSAARRRAPTRSTGSS